MLSRIFFASLLSFCLCASASPVETFTPEDVLDLSESIAYSEEKTTEESVSVYVLVSVSMPNASLMRLARDSKDAGIPLVFRGVPETKQETDKKPLPLLNPQSISAFQPLIESGASVELNPEIFSEYGIKEAPVLLFVRESSSGCPQAPSALLIPGDVTLGFALDQITERQDAFGQKAKALRSKLGARA